MPDGDRDSDDEGGLPNEDQAPDDGLIDLVEGEQEEEQYFTDPEDIIDLARLTDSVIRVSPTPIDSSSAAAAPTKAELLRSLSYLEAELQASDAAIAALRADQARLVFYQAKYGRFGLADSLNTALGGQHQAAPSAAAADSTASTADEESQLSQLENLIDTQRRAHLRMTEQLNGLRNKLKKACRDLIEERCKHEQDSAEGDDVLAGLGKERERLLNELEYERVNNRRHEKELKRQLRALDEVRTANTKQRAVSLEQIRQRKRATEQLVEVAERCRQLEARQSRQTASSGILADVDKLEAEAAAGQRRVAELGRLAQAEAAAADKLAAEVESLRLKLTTATTSSSSLSLLSSSAASSTASISARRAKPEPPVRRTSAMTTAPAAASPRLASPAAVTVASSPRTSTSRLPTGGGSPSKRATPSGTAASGSRVLTAGAANGK